MRVTSLLLLTLGLPALADGTTIEVQDFSPLVSGRIFLEKPGEVFSPGWVAIVDKKSKRELFRITSDELAVGDLAKDGTAKANVHEAPYGEQSVIISEDFDFDGQKDLAVMDGQNSCYHGPSYQVYLARKTGFVLSPQFTQLAQDYCGFFQLDAKAKRLHTSMKDGCCSHEYTTFAVIDGVPVEESSLSEDGRTAPLLVVTRTTAGKSVTEKQLMLDFPGVQRVARFTLADGRSAVLFVLDDLLEYALLDAKERVELLVPAADEPLTFEVHATAPLSVRFTRPGATYVLTQSGTGAAATTAIDVTTPKKHLVLQGKPGSLVGGLEQLSGVTATNLQRK